jgi:hypothetical protein
MTSHDYARFDEYDDVEPDINDHRFCTPDDVRDWVRQDSLISCKAYNEIWLLDSDGAYVGCYTSRSVVRIRDLAADPSRLLEATRLARAEVAHPHWLIFENREGSERNPSPTKGDTQAFVALREAVAPSATLVDAVIIGAHGSWSLHELLAPGEPYSLRAS